jgi:4-hydroxy-tetrahydrodipicolinate reductase
MKTIIMGPAGKMGRAMVACADNHPNIELVGAIGPEGKDYIGKDIGLIYCSIWSKRLLHRWVGK